MMKVCSILLLCSPTVADVATSALRDQPIAANVLQYLDGDDWEASGQARSYTGSCVEQKGVDFTETSLPAVTPIAYAPTLERCCEQCGATAGCAASVFVSYLPPGPPPTPSSGCDWFLDTDWHEDTELTTIGASDKEACCGACHASEPCTVAVFYGGQCYLKAAGDDGAYSREGRIACKVKAPTPSPTPPPSPGCNFTVGYDMHPETLISSAPAASAAECCHQCSANADCIVGVLDDGRCYLKGAGDVSGGSYPRDGRTLCQPIREVKPALPNGDTCYFHTEAELESKVTEQHPASTACIPDVQLLTPFTIDAAVPGDLVSDLQRAGRVADPLHGTNFQDPEQVAQWNGEDWDYQKTFELAQEMADDSALLLVFEGVKMGANVSLNGQNVGITTNQHRRYTFDVTDKLKVGENIMSVRFQRSIPNDGRFMACSGGWDWAPYSRMRDVQGHPFFTRGIWKSVYLAKVPAIAITYLVPLVMYSGEWPTTMIADGDADFAVNVTAHLWAPTASSGTLHLRGEWGAETEVHVEVPAGDSTVTVQLPAEGVDLWWPVGMGPQRMYNVSATFHPDSEDAQEVTAARRIGFRLATLVTGNDTDSSWVAANVNGNGNAIPSHTLMFRINGAPALMKGANMIPMETLEGRYVPGMHKQIVRSAADGGMNMLRIWGGGIYPVDEWLDACDEEGVMVFEDMAYGTDGIMPGASATADQEAELRHQVRRQSHHPSIVAWCGCNECGGDGVWTSFVMTTVASEDASRVIRSASPFGLYKSGVNTISGLPNGEPLIESPNVPEDSDSPWPPAAEQHGPYQHGGIFPAVNGGGGLFTPPVVVGVQPGYAIGTSEPGYMKTETGCSVMSSFESMSATLDEKDWSLHSEPMHERNYPCDPIVLSYFGQDRNLSMSGEAAFKEQLYLCMLGAGLQRKTNIESWRSTNVWAILLWQLNEIWPTGGWGSLEYGTPVAGQVLGGRWKPLHHFMADSAFADVTAACGSASVVMDDASDSAKGPALCYVRNDLPVAFSGRIQVSLIHFQHGDTKVLTDAPVTLAPGAGALKFFCAASGLEPEDSKPDCETFESMFSAQTCAEGGADCMLSVAITDADGAVVSSNTLPLASPSSFNLLPAEVSYTVAEAAAGSQEVAVELRSTQTALYVWLSTLEHGRFSRNGFVLLAGQPVTVTFQSFLPVGTSSAALSASLRVEHLQMYMTADSSETIAIQV